MSHEQIADIVSDELMAIVHAQFLATEKKFLSKEAKKK
jgi:hypothetical protein